jgi:hypothetical protein
MVTKEVVVSESATGSSKGCMIIIGVIFAVFFVLLGVIGIGELLGAWDPDQPPAAQSDGPPPDRSDSPSPSPTGSAGCADATAAFRTFAGPRPGMSPEILDKVTSVCWEPTGELRAEAAYAADVNTTFGPIVTLCRTLSDFVAGSGRTWRGFTVYSSNQITPGKPFLAGATEGAPCTNPQRRG